MYLQVMQTLNNNYLGALDGLEGSGEYGAGGAYQPNYWIHYEQYNSTHHHHHWYTYQNNYYGGRQWW